MISTDNSDSIKSTQALKFKKLNITKGNPLPQMPPISIINNSIKNDYINETTRDINIKFKDDINNAVITDSQSIRPTIDDTIYSSFSSLSTLKSSSESPDVSPFATPISDAVTDTNTSSSLDQSSYAFVSSLDHFPCDIVRSLWLIQSLNLKIANLQDQLNIELNNLNNDNTSKLNPENYLCIKEKLLKFSNEAISESKYLINKINFHGSIVGHNINLMNNLKNIRLKLLRERNWSNFNNFKKDYLKKLPPYQIKEIENSIGILENESEPYFPDFFNKKELSSYNLKVKNHFNRNQNDDSNNNSSLITAKQGLSTIQNSNFGLMKDSTTQENRIQGQKIKEESPSGEFTISKEIIEDPNPTEKTDTYAAHTELPDNAITEMDREIKKPLNESPQSGKGTNEILESPLFEDKRLILSEQKEKKNGLPFSSVSGISTPVPLSSSTISTTPSPVSQTPPIESSAKIHNTREKDKLQRKEKLKIKSVKSKDQGIPTRVRPLRSSMTHPIDSNEGNYEKVKDKTDERKEKKSRKRKTEETHYDETQEDEGQEDLNEEEERYCYCRGSSVGKMIACDNPECKIEWFHYKCVALKEDPKDYWFCPDCIKFKDEILEKLKLQKPKRRKKRKAYY